MMRIVNLGVAVVFAAGVTFALFFLMQFLISMDATEPEQGEGRKIADITMPEIELEVQRQEPKPEEPDVPEEIPDSLNQGHTLTSIPLSLFFIINSPLFDE